MLLEEFPHSARRGEAAIGLGRIVFDGGEIGEAAERPVPEPVAKEILRAGTKREIHLDPLDFGRTSLASLGAMT